VATGAGQHARKPIPVHHLSARPARTADRTGRSTIDSRSRPTPQGYTQLCRQITPPAGPAGVQQLSDRITGRQPDERWHIWTGRRWLILPLPVPAPARVLLPAPAALTTSALLGQSSSPADVGASASMPAHTTFKEVSA
jgi:hypothetical protein